MHARTHEPPRAISYIYSQCANGMCVCVYARTLPVSPWTSATSSKFATEMNPGAFGFNGTERTSRAIGCRQGERARHDAQARILLQSSGACAVAAEDETAHAAVVLEDDEGEDKARILPSGPAPHPGGESGCPSAPPPASRAPMRLARTASLPPLLQGRFDCSSNRPCTALLWRGLAWALA